MPGPPARLSWWTSAKSVAHGSRCDRIYDSITFLAFYRDLQRFFYFLITIFRRCIALYYGGGRRRVKIIIESINRNIHYHVRNSRSIDTEGETKRICISAISRGNTCVVGLCSTAEKKGRTTSVSTRRSPNFRPPPSCVPCPAEFSS